MHSVGKLKGTVRRIETAELSDEQERNVSDVNGEFVMKRGSESSRI